jgi:hypothetical protein
MPESEVRHSRCGLSSLFTIFSDGTDGRLKRRAPVRAAVGALVGISFAASTARRSDARLRTVPFTRCRARPTYSTSVG